MPKKTIYLFGGLGTDERVFQRLDLSSWNTVPVKWITPEKGSTLEEYAKEILKQITSPDPVLMGISFGGMMAIEVAKKIQAEKIILLSSSKTKKEIPSSFKILGKLGIHKLVPPGLIKNSTGINNWLFGAKTASDKKLLKEIISDTDSDFLKWAMHSIVHWKNMTIPKNVFHIHGTADKVLPIRYVNCDLKIKNGSHLMVLDKADEISAILKAHI